MNQVFEWDRYEECRDKYQEAAGTGNSSAQKEQLSDWYDYGDTLIGGWIKQIAFHISVKADSSSDEGVTGYE